MLSSPECLAYKFKKVMEITLISIAAQVLQLYNFYLVKCIYIAVAYVSSG